MRPFSLNLAMVILVSLPGALGAAEFFVAPDGREQNPGTQEAPFGTLAQARDAIRTLHASGKAREPITVWVRAGTYCLAETWKLSAEDSGTADAPIVYRAWGGEQPVISGGRPVTGFVPHQGEILKADLASQGLQGVGFRQLFFAGQRQHLARYPNFDPANPYGGGWAYADGKMVSMYQNVPGEDRRTLVYKPADDRPWANPQEGEVFVFPRYNWWNNIVRIASVDRQSRRITLVGDCSYAIRPGDRYYVRGLREELDAPGEWYLDRQSATLYFWPPEPLADQPVFVPVVRPLVEMRKTSYVTLRGLVFECTEGSAVVMRDCTACLVAGCTIRNLGDYNSSAVVIDGGQRNGAVGNDIGRVGRDAVSISGGDRVTLTPAENYADNNYIHHVGVEYKQGVGVYLSGCGNRASHNLIHDGPRFGILFMGNQLVIEYNHIRHVNLETADTGAVYTGGRDWISSRGTVIRYNYFHDILGYGREGDRWVSPHYCWGIYLDDNTGGVDVIGNVVARCIRGLVHLHNARDNLIENNILIDGKFQQVECNGWTASHPYWVNHLPQMIQVYESVIQQTAWRALRHMDIHSSQAVLPSGLIMANNVLRRNIIYYRDPDAKLFRFFNVPWEKNQSDYNLVYHPGQALRLEVRPVPKEGPPVDTWEAWQTFGQDVHSLVADPLFVDPEHEDYRLRPESPAWQLGFQPIPLEKIGPYADPLRASWPIVEAEGAREKPPMPEMRVEP